MYSTSNQEGNPQTFRMEPERYQERKGKADPTATRAGVFAAEAAMMSPFAVIKEFGEDCQATPFVADESAPRT